MNIQTATAPSTLTKAEKAELVIYTAQLSGIDITVTRAVKAYRHLLDSAYLKAKATQPAYSGQCEDIAHLYEELGWELPKVPKAKKPVPTSDQLITAAAQVVKAKAAPATPPTMTYREMQCACKALGLKANGSTDTLRRRLEGRDLTKVNFKPEASAPSGVRNSKADATYVDTPVPTPKAAPKARKPKAEKRTHHGLSYREAQQVVTFLRNCGGYSDATLVKNVGWDNVAANLDNLMAQPRWGCKMTKTLLDGCPALAKLRTAK